MTLLAPLALGLLLLLPAIFVIHLLRGSRTRVVVPATFLWRDLPRGAGARNRWRRPPLTLLLLLQLLVALVGAWALARPAAIGQPPRHLALVLDASASMQATDAAPSRFEVARATAKAQLDGLGADDLATLVLAGPHPRLLASGDPALARAALAGARPAATRGAVREAIALAEGELARSADRAGGQVLVLTDGAFGALPPLGTLAAPVRFVTIGSGDANQGIVGLEVRPDPQGRRQEAFVAVANASDRAMRLPLRVFADDVPQPPQSVDVAAHGRAVADFDVPAETARVTVRLAGRDALALDDVAERSTPSLKPRRVALVSSSEGPVRRALEAIPYVTLAAVTPGDPLPAQSDLTVLDGFLPGVLPSGPLLLIHPPRGSELLRVQGDVVPGPVVGGDERHPLLQGVDLGALRVGAASEVGGLPWAREVLGAERAPLILAGAWQGRSAVLFTFDPQSEGLDKSIAFPLLVSNAVSYLLADAPGPTVAAGDEVVLPAPSDQPATLIRPDGSREALPAAGGEFRVARTDEVGRYLVQDADGQPLRTFSVNLLDPVETDIRPRQLDPIAATVPAAPPGTAGVGREWWWPLLALAFGLLAVEWLVFARRGA